MFNIVILTETQISNLFSDLDVKRTIGQEGLSNNFHRLQ